MTATLPDYRRDPPELERDMPGAHLDTEAGHFVLVFLSWTLLLIHYDKKKK